MKTMYNLDNDLSSKQREFKVSLEKASNKDLLEQKDKFREKTPAVIHLNSLITKNIYLFQKIPTIACLPGL